MDRKRYRYETASVAGFVSQVVRYVSAGYYFYVRIRIPDRKCPVAVDRKLLELYDIAQPAWRRERRNLKKSAGIHYLRHGRLAVIMLTKGRHERFYADHGRSVLDIRRTALKVFGYSIRYSYSAAEKRMKVFVRLDDERYRELRSHLLTIATWESYREPERMARELARLPVQVYEPVFGQLLTILRQLNRSRRRRGFRTVPVGSLPCKVQLRKVFVENGEEHLPGVVSQQEVAQK